MDYRGSRSAITGAGVVLLETYKGKQCVTLFRDKNRRSDKGHKMYEEGGGRLELGESKAGGAVRELKEESCNLFRLDPRSLTDHQIYHDLHRRYRAYIVHVEGPNNQISSKRYYKNLRILKRNDAPKDWLDTDRMGRFEVKQLLSDNLLTQSGELVTKLENGRRATIAARTKACIRELYILTKNFTNVPVVHMISNKNFRGDQRFLNGTKCYYT